MDEVRAWSEKVLIPTYKVGEPDKNPMFLEKRVYQGSSGVVYPHSVIDRVYDQKEDCEYTAVYLENEYLKIMILPEIGGRLQMAFDKTNDRHFVYYNQVIKPALVGLAGPWVSGGIEFNWPQHHRPTTFDPLDWRIESHSDGSQTVWCAEIEPMFRTKGMHGFRLYPGRAYLEVQVQLYNRTALPQTFLWWANPAVAVHDETQSVFPPDVHAVMDHGKRDVSSFPIATGTYYKVNYAPGTDISRYKNIPVPTSYMAYHSDFDFMGDYDHRAQAGMLHIADHHIVPGKKQWTWGSGEFGQVWDRHLTDEDGPYIELMCGAYTDNQPDFSWLQPGEEKSFSQFFMPYQKIGPAVNANQDVAVSLQLNENIAQFGVYSSAPRQMVISLDAQGQNLYRKEVSLAPAQVLLDETTLPSGLAPEMLTLSVWQADKRLLSFSPLPQQTGEIPAPATPARRPREIESLEELYLNGLHLEQYRHATYAPEPYYLEALRRDPGESRCNNAMGLLLLRRGKFEEAERYFRTAIARQTLRNPNPYDGEAYYNLGQALTMQERFPEAYNAFYKAAWNEAWQSAAYFELGCLANRAGDVDQSLKFLEQSLARNQHHGRARLIKTALLRRTGQEEAALKESQKSLALDALDYGALWEQHLSQQDPTFELALRADPATQTELALDYAHAALWQEAIDLLEAPAQSDPLAAYTLGWVLSQAGQPEEAKQIWQKAAQLPSDYCFPNRLEDVLIFEAAMRVNPQDARAPYYLGNFWYAHRRHQEAIEAWERAAQLDPQFPTVFRNLGLAYFNKQHDAAIALTSFEKAFSLNPADARVFFELDQLYKRLNRTPAERLEILQSHLPLLAERDDLTIEYISALNLVGRPNAAYQHLMARSFHPWEGGEGKVSGQYVLSLVEMAKNALDIGNFDSAITYLMQAQTYPPNLGEGKLFGARENNIHYYLGCAFQASGDLATAKQWFKKATKGSSEPASALYYNDQPPDMIFYQGLAERALQNENAANMIFDRLIDYGKTHLSDQMVVDYFAVSLPEFLVFDLDLEEHNRIHCLYMLALGYLGKGDLLAARQSFDQVLALNANHIGATIHSKMAIDE